MTREITVAGDLTEDVPMATSAEIAESTASTLAAIGLRIREARSARNMTLQSLAAASGLSTSMLSLVERGRASPSIGSLVVIASALGITMSDLVSSEPTSEEKLVVRANETPAIETAQHVVRRLLRDDRARGVTVAVNEYQPQTGSADRPMSHAGFEYGYVLEGRLTVEVDGAVYILNPGDLIAYLSQRPHRIWNHGSTVVRTLWFNIDRH
ncbi:helix-turn-helix domain-containing protein [Methylobacterium organophilum]|uniref:HTH-type transcriptional regulator PuuR n=1 Tax=Methylobacterium organophilum TaxID=410 RepID=A0ABQ4TCM2_METOR|nr:cupin domain-containing protein [Methylobacterium organophilum]UMY18627.1 cupin domain-containing protein [Methylobacterium organophilum]GJE29427.1 HTH-type transcriptional regulator PuuR [Methylobacterium organophilum]